MGWNGAYFLYLFEKGLGGVRSSRIEPLNSSPPGITLPLRGHPAFERKLRLSSVPGFAEPALPLIGHLRTQSKDWGQQQEGWAWTFDGASGSLNRALGLEIGTWRLLFIFFRLGLTGPQQTTCPQNGAYLLYLFDKE